MSLTLILGANGFVGKAILPMLNNGGNAIGSGQSLGDWNGLNSLLASQPWTHIVNLAGLSHVPTCDANPQDSLRDNLFSVATLIGAVERSAPQARVIQASTAQVYAPGPSVLIEESKIGPANLYGVHKWQAECLLREAADRGKTKTTILRLFNHAHVTQPPIFFMPQMWKQLREAKEQGVHQFTVGNLNLHRDINSVQELGVVIGKLVDRVDRKASPFETFNVSTGHGKSLRKIVDLMAATLEWSIEIVVDPMRLRKGEPESIVGNSSKLQRAINWTPHARDEASLLAGFLAPIGELK